MPDAGGGVRADHPAQLITALAGAGQMGHRAHRGVLRDRLGGDDRPVPGRAGRAVGDRDEVRAERLQLADGLPQLTLLDLVLRREELEGEQRPIGGLQQLGDGRRPRPEPCGPSRKLDRELDRGPACDHPRTAASPASVGSSCGQQRPPDHGRRRAGSPEPTGTSIPGRHLGRDHRLPDRAVGGPGLDGTRAGAGAPDGRPAAVRRQAAAAGLLRLGLRRGRRVVRTKPTCGRCWPPRPVWTCCTSARSCTTT